MVKVFTLRPSLFWNVIFFRSFGFFGGLRGALSTVSFANSPNNVLGIDCFDLSFVRRNGPDAAA